DWTWGAAAYVTDPTFPSGAAKLIEGDITVRQQGTVISWEAPKLKASAARLTSLKRLKPADYEVGTRGTVNLATRMVGITQAQLTGAPGTASGKGSYAIKTGGFDFAGAASVERLADFAPLTGAARGQWTAKRSGFDAPIRIGADATGRKVGSAT